MNRVVENGGIMLTIGGILVMILAVMTLWSFLAAFYPWAPVGLIVLALIVLPGMK